MKKRRVKKKKSLEKKEKEVSEEVCMKKRQEWFSRVNGGFSKRWYKRGKDQKGEKEIERKNERFETTSRHRFSC